MQFFHYDTIGSTNEQAKRLIAEYAIRDAACIIARAQTAGRGTRGRSWASPRDAGLYLTLVERRPPDAPLRMTTLYTVAAGVACAETLRELTALAVTIKPVNDLYCGGGKLGGILCESVVDRGRMTALLVGIGINVRNAARQPADGREAAITDLETLLGPSGSIPSQKALVDAIVPAVRRSIQRADRDEMEELPDGWARSSKDAHAFPPGELPSRHSHANPATEP